ncbi:MAG TPA: hypothetical protein HPP77_03910 [Candidatus Hydrogenedentes bacterium]|nr:hypothetical protein [Candidatus Hydrogenedentota bacterium]HIJ73074.1 hypothetical protein [Candidatus Hydrogenedentota bacterium]
MTEFYKNSPKRLALGETTFVHRGDCEFEIIRQPEESFFPWSLHSMIEGSSIGLYRKMPCNWAEGSDAVTAEIVQPGIGQITWRFTEGPKGLLRFTMTIANQSGQDWGNVYVNVHNFPSPRPFRGEQTYVEAGGQIKEVRALWPEDMDAGQGLYPYRGKDMAARFVDSKWVIVPCSLTAPFVFRIGGGNEPSPHARWCESRPIVAAMVCERINAVLINFVWPCLDLEMDFGHIAAGQAVSQDGLIGIMEGTANDFLTCAREFLKSRTGTSGDSATP